MERARSKYILLLISIITIFIVVGCNTTLYQRSLYDDDSKIISEGDSYTYGLRRGMTSSNKTEIKFGEFTGMDTLYHIKADNNSKIKIDFSSKVKNGNFKVVFIDADNKITKILEGTIKGSINLPVLKGLNRIKIIGRHAAGEINLRLHPENGVEIINVSD